jgi:3-mercaptopyruvate sulfurtransferase SseA/sterol desaturase/sphingolipid hydroxylase (fatty acid hydroxylase superfamily)
MTIAALLQSWWFYPACLALFSVAVFGLEALFKWRRDQPQLRPFLWSDALHLVFNGHFLGLILFGVAAHHVLPRLDDLLAAVGVVDGLYRNAAAAWPVWAQIVVALVVIDFFQWCVHNALHRVPLLWETHKTHHSVQDGEMDWIVSFRFQWTEVVIYRAVLFFPLAWFGFGFEAILFHAVFGTLIGHLNHSNLAWDYGPLKYVLNSPKMHIWHHDYDGDTKTTVNFGIIFSTWDWIFGTARMPEHPPAKLGFRGVETFPRDFFSQMSWPIPRYLPAGAPGRALSVTGGVAVLGLGFVMALPPGPPDTPMLGETAATSQPTASLRGFDYAVDPDQATARLAAFGSDARARGYAHPEWMVSADELAAALGSPRLRLLDVRPTARFEEGRLPTAQPVDRGDYSRAEPAPGVSSPPHALQAMLRARGVHDGDVIVAYGDGGPEPYRLWWTLKMMTGLEIRVLDGGMTAWIAAGHGLAAGPPLAVAAGDVSLPALHATSPSLWADIGPRLASSPEVVLLDTRSVAEFTGEEQDRSAVRAGRIPGARHLDWWTVWRDGEADSRMLPPDALRALAAAHGIDGETPVVTMCQSGTRSATVQFALLQAGHDPAAIVNYDGSWAEYSRLADLPIETGPPRVLR